ncbi:MAG TPA: glycosyl hydrolase family 5 [Ruminococcaceae bacterium]|nr:glycosyl hydrolase family 5 [Oscillospiraceae bacterium]
MEKLIGFKKGVNLGGWLSQCDYSTEHLNSFIAEKDFKKIASWGVDHVRIPIDYNIVQNTDGTIKESGIAYIDNALEMCKKYGLNTVIDLHKTAGFSFDKGENESGFFDDEKYRQLFYSLWEELAKRYGNSESIVFELLNEITDREFSKKWNETAKECIKRIRTHAKDTVIFVGGYWNNSIDAIKDLEPPYDDRVAYTFHCYNPMPFTHQLAWWVDNFDVSQKKTYEECGCCAEDFVKAFKEAWEIARKNNTVLYCSEYGVIDKASPSDTLKWYKDINSAFEHYGIGRCAWNYKEKDFGLSDKNMEGVIDEVRKYL